MHFTAPSKFVILLVTRIKVQIEDVVGAISALVIGRESFPEETIIQRDERVSDHFLNYYYSLAVFRPVDHRGRMVE